MDYPNLGENQLNGCVIQSNAMIGVLTKIFGFQIADIRQLRDDHPQAVPSRANILAGIAWLIDGAQAGDQLFLHYSGHGGRSRPRSQNCSAESDGQDETLVPCDFQTAGTIDDEELRQRVVLALPEGVNLLVILDCCHNGTVLGLPFKVLLHQDSETASIARKPAKYVRETGLADILVLSSCMRGQDNGRPCHGVLSAAFIHAVGLASRCSCYDLLGRVQAFLTQQGTGVVPQLSSEHFLDLESMLFPDVEQATPGIPMSVSPSLRPPNRKALTVGINYLSLPPGRGHLSNAIDDSDKMLRALTGVLGVPERYVRQLRDDSTDESLLPTHANLLQEFKNLTCDVVPGDELFFHFSGHAGQLRGPGAITRKNRDGISPCDFQHAGTISGEKLRQLLVTPLPAGVRLTMVLDGGATLDAPFRFLLQGDDRTAKVMRGSKSPLCRGEVTVISEFQDEQGSSDFVAESMGGRKGLGALTQAFVSCVSESISYHKLLQRMRRFLRKQGYLQVPQIGSEQFLKLDESIVQHEKGRPSSRPNSSAVCPPSQCGPGTSGKGECLIDMELAQMEAQVRELRRKKAEEEQASAAAQVVQPNPEPNFLGLPSLGTSPPLVPSAPDGRPACGIAGHGPFHGRLPRSLSIGSIDTKQPPTVNSSPLDTQPLRLQTSAHAFAIEPLFQSSGSSHGLAGPSGATSNGLSAPKQNYPTGTQAPPLGGHQRYSPRQSGSELDMQLAQAKAHFEELQARKLAGTQAAQQRRATADISSSSIAVKPSVQTHF